MKNSRSTSVVNFSSRPHQSTEVYTKFLSHGLMSFTLAFKIMIQYRERFQINAF